MSDAWIVKRRPRRPSAMQRHRFVEAQIAAGRSAVAFPGSVMPEPEGARERLVSSAASILLHSAFLLLFVLLAHIAKEEIIEETIEISLPKQAEDEPAAARPRAIAESMKSFAPAAMALPPQVINPTVIQPRVAPVEAAQVKLAEIQPLQAPSQVAPIQAPEVPQVRQFQSPIIANPTAPRVLDNAQPQLAGRPELQAPTGTLAGPRQVTNTGNTVGIADPQALGTGSSVQEGIASNRDVHGGKTGDRASVNAAVGPDGGRGTGGTGTGPGGVSFEDCQRRPEVTAYIAHIKQRMDARWHPPSDIPVNEKVQLRFRIDPSGSTSDVQFVTAASPALGQSAVEAMRAASPFDPIPEAARCLTNDALIASFRIPD